MARTAAMSPVGSVLIGGGAARSAVAAISPTRMAYFFFWGDGNIGYSVVDLPSATLVVSDDTIPYDGIGEVDVAYTAAAALSGGRVFLVTPYDYCILSGLDGGWSFDVPWTAHGVFSWLSTSIGVVDTGTHFVLVGVGGDMGFSRAEVGYDGTLLTAAHQPLAGWFDPPFLTNPVYLDGDVWWIMAREPGGEIGAARFTESGGSWHPAGLSGGWSSASQTAVYEGKAYVLAGVDDAWDTPHLITISDGTVSAELHPDSVIGTFQPPTGPPGEPQDLFFAGAGGRSGLLSMHGGFSPRQQQDLYGRWSMASLPGWVVELLSTRINIYSYVAEDDEPEPRPEPSWSLRAGTRVSRGYFS